MGGCQIWEPETSTWRVHAVRCLGGHGNMQWVMPYLCFGQCRSCPSLSMFQLLCLSFCPAAGWGDAIQVLSDGITEWMSWDVVFSRPSLCFSRAPGSCSVIEYVCLWQFSYSFNKYLRPCRVPRSILGTWDTHHWTKWIRTPALLEFRYSIGGKQTIYDWHDNNIIILFLFSTVSVIKRKSRAESREWKEVEMLSRIRRCWSKNF